eukprot:2689013-Amphidinium_carterae.1
MVYNGGVLGRLFSKNSKRDEDVAVKRVSQICDGLMERNTITFDCYETCDQPAIYLRSLVTDRLHLTEFQTSSSQKNPNQREQNWSQDFELQGQGQASAPSKPSKQSSTRFLLREAASLWAQSTLNKVRHLI